MTARSRLSRAPTISSRAATCEITHGCVRASTYLIAASLPREISIRTLLSTKNGMHELRSGNQPWSSRRSRLMYATLSAMSSRSFHKPAKGVSPMEGGLLKGASTGTLTSTSVPSFIRTS